MYKAYVTVLTNVRKHPNADRLLLADVFGNTVCVSTDHTEGQLGVYFPTDGQLSVEFAEKNNLVRKKDDAGNNIGGYMDPDKRNVTAIRLRGEKSDGLFLPISALDYCYAHGDASIELFVGDVIDGLVNGHEICCKYIPRSNTRRGTVTEGNRTRKKKVATAPLFKEHADTEQLAYNLGAFKPGDEIEITLKMHGTSQRTGYLPVLQGHEDSPWCELRNAWRKLWHDLFKEKTPLEEEHDGEPVYDYGYVSGTRRVVLENYEGGFYGDNQFREQHSKAFEGKLWKGETVYYEVVGFTTSGAPIMGDASNKKLNDKEFIKQYGETTRFSYGCRPDGGTGFDPALYDNNTGELVMMPPQSDIYVYRMTMTNPDGEVVEYTPDFMRYRCEQMAVKTVPVFWRGFIPTDLKTDAFFMNSMGEFDDWVYAENAGEWVKQMAEQFYDGPDPVGKTHVREGVVVRIINRPKFAAYKHKNFSFKVLEGIAKVDAEAPDMEEAQEVDNG
jgi:hypothetical protein